MNKLKKITLLSLIGVSTYIFYKKCNASCKEYSTVEKCKKIILKKGYEIKDSWCLNLPENNYLEFTFTDYKNNNYSVIFNKLNNSIISMREV